MSRKLMAILVSTTLVFGHVNSSAWAAPDNAGKAQMVQAAAAVKNQSPLPPGGAASLKQAQGEGIGPLAAIAIVAGLFLVGVLLLDDDDDDDGSTSTTGT